LSAIHDAAQQARNLRQVLEEGKQRIGCFLGAGCPLGIFDAAGEKSMVLIPAVELLTKRVALGLEARDQEVLAKTAGAAPGYKKAWDSLCEECKPTDGTPHSVEDVLTELRTLASRRGSSEMLGMTKKKLIELDVEICALIVGEMKKSLPEHRNSYNRHPSFSSGSLSPGRGRESLQIRKLASGEPRRPGVVGLAKGNAVEPTRRKPLKMVPLSTERSGTQLKLGVNEIALTCVDYVFQRPIFCPVFGLAPIYL
jgi:hypothetical protein